MQIAAPDGGCHFRGRTVFRVGMRIKFLHNTWAVYWQKWLLSIYWTLFLSNSWRHLQGGCNIVAGRIRPPTPYLCAFANFTPSFSVYWGFLKNIHCLSWISLNSLFGPGFPIVVVVAAVADVSTNPPVFTIRRQLVDRNPEPKLLPTHGIFNSPHQSDRVWEQLAFDGAVSDTQQWKFKLSEVMVWEIEQPNFRLGI